MSWRDELAQARVEIAEAAERKKATEKARLAGRYEPETHVATYTELYESAEETE